MCVWGVPIFLGGPKIHFNPLEEVVGIPFIFWWPQQAEESQSFLLIPSLPLRGSHCKLCSLYLTPTIASTEPEHGPNMDLLGTSPKASLGQYATWQVQAHWERVGLQGSFQVCSCLVMWTEAPGD